jgi:hypothetical protein
MKLKLKSTLVVGTSYLVITELNEKQFFIFDGKDDVGNLDIRLLPNLEESFLCPTDKVYLI